MALSFNNLSVRRFTLVELLVAMSILVVIMLMIMQILIYSQRIWSTNNAQTQIYENGRAAVEVLERDLRSVLTSTLPGRQIAMYVGDPDPEDDSKSLHTCLVTSTDSATDAKSRLAEVSYRYHHQLNSTSSIKPLFLYRQVVSDADSVNWDFNNRPTDWYLNNKSSSDLPAPEKVIGGVMEFSLKCFDKNDEEIPPDTETMETPIRIEIYLLIFDERLKNQPEHIRLRTARAFTKFIQPASQITN